MLRHWDEADLGDLLAAHGLAGLPESPFPNDGWSGATLTQIRRGDERFVLKRTSWARDWIARATRDHAMREGFVAAGRLPLPSPFVSPYLGAAADGTAVAMLMPDLTGRLVTWERPDGAPTLTPASLRRTLDAIVRLHGTPTDAFATATSGRPWPWCPLRERLLLLTRPSARRFVADGVAAGERFLAGWDAFDRHATPAVRDLIDRLSADPEPLIAALGRLPDALLHGDLKVANLALLDGDAVALIDWQMVMRAPVAVDLGWFLVANSSALPADPLAVMTGYLDAAGRSGQVPVGDPTEQADLTWLVGLLLRGWRKGLDADAGRRLASGVPATADLAWWGMRAVEAADRRL